MKLVLSFCFAALLAPIDLKICAGCSDEPRRPAAQLAADYPLAQGREPSAPPDGDDQVKAGTVEDFWDSPDQGLGWQWSEERPARNKEPSVEATTPPARQIGAAKAAPKETDENWDDPDQGLGWQWPVTDMPATP